VRGAAAELVGEALRCAAASEIEERRTHLVGCSAQGCDVLGLEVAVDEDDRRDALGDLGDDRGKGPLADRERARKG